MANFLEDLDAMKTQVQDTEKDSIPVFKEKGFDWIMFRAGMDRLNMIGFLLLKLF